MHVQSHKVGVGLKLNWMVSTAVPTVMGPWCTSLCLTMGTAVPTVMGPWCTSLSLCLTMGTAVPTVMGPWYTSLCLTMGTAVPTVMGPWCTSLCLTVSTAVPTVMGPWCTSPPSQVARSTETVAGTSRLQLSSLSPDPVNYSCLTSQNGPSGRMTFQGVCIFALVAVTLRSLGMHICIGCCDPTVSNRNVSLGRGYKNEVATRGLYVPTLPWG
jgi:hypothetical protein